MKRFLASWTGVVLGFWASVSIEASAQTLPLEPPAVNSSTFPVAVGEAELEPVFDSPLFHIQIDSSEVETLPLNLTLESLQAKAIARNPGLAVIGEKIHAAKWQWQNVGLKPNPVVGYSASDVGVEGTLGQQGVMVKQKFLRGSKLEYRRAVVFQEIRYLEQLHSVQRQKLMTDISKQYYTVLVLQQKFDLISELVKISDESAKVNKRLWENSEGRKIDYLQANVELGKANVQWKRVETDLHRNWQRLAMMMFDEDMPLQRLQGSLIEEEIPLQWESSLERLLRESPEISAAMASVEKARWVINREKSETIQDVSTSLTLSNDSPSRDAVVGMQVTIPLPVYNRNQFGVRRAYSELNAALNDVAQVELRLRHRLSTEFAKYEKAQMEMRRFKQEILPPAKETLQIVRKGFSVGEIGYIEVLTSQRTYFQVSLSNLDAKAKLWNARQTIEGLLLENSLESME